MPARRRWPVAQEKAAGLDDVGRYAQAGAETQQSAAVLRNVGFEEHEVHGQRFP